MTARTPAQQSIRRLNRLGLLSIVILVVVFGGWAVTARFSGAVLAAGRVVVESEIKTIQHPTGGVVAELLVRDGTQVAAGDVVIRLDGTVPRSELAIIVGRLDELYARQALLAAERDDRPTVAFPDRLTSRQQEQPVAALLTSTVATFDLRRSSRLGAEAELRQQIAQLREEIAGQERQHQAMQTEMGLLRAQLANFQELLAQNLIQRSQVIALERDLASLDGQVGQLEASIASAGARISELELAIMSLGNDARSEAADELQALGADIVELQERQIAAEDRLLRIDIRAPQDGIIYGLAVHTIGGVIGPGDQLMTVVPVTDALLVEARVSPPERDQLYVGQQVSISLEAFNRATNTRLNGAISSISADTTADERTGAVYYTVRIVIADGETSAATAIVPGMLATAFIETETRTVASFLLKPLIDQFALAFRER